MWISSPGCANHDGGIYDVAGAAGGEQDTSLAAECRIEQHKLDEVEGTSQERWAGPHASPNLRMTPPRHRDSSGEPLLLEASHPLLVAGLDGRQDARVKNDRRRELDPRTTRALARSCLRALAISSSVMTLLGLVFGKGLSERVQPLLVLEASDVAHR